MRTFSFEVAGDPKTQGSMTHVGGGRMIHNPELVVWRNRVQAAAVRAALARGIRIPIDDPVHVEAHFRLEKPGRPGKPLGATGLDLDKLQRAIGDALSPDAKVRQGKVLSNDNRIVSWQASKHWAKPGDEGVSVSVVIIEPGDVVSMPCEECGREMALTYTNSCRGHGVLHGACYEKRKAREE
ncbi:RusA family crossover junction endodeoxyribonuclease [Arcanobacterium canis]